MSDTPQPELVCTTREEAGTHTLAARLAALASPGDVFALEGEVGAGKTVFARGFIAARLTAETEVPSPTFTLVQIYDHPGLPSIWHFDLYRLSDPTDAYDLDIETAFATGISLVEWPERLGALLPPRALTIRIAVGSKPDERHIALLPRDPAWRSRLSEAGFVH